MAKPAASPTDREEALRLIRAILDDAPGITLGWTGFADSFRDERRFHLWVDGTYKPSGAQEHIWSCEASQLHKCEVASARKALEKFKLGYEAGRRAPVQVISTLFEHPGTSSYYDNTIWCPNPKATKGDQGRWLRPGQSLVVIGSPPKPSASDATTQT